MDNLIEQLKFSVIVSCQARHGEPFDSPHYITEFAISAEIGGASGLRINGKENIRAVKKEVKLPIIGIKKKIITGCDIYITPTLEDVDEVIKAGAEIVGMDGTNRRRPQGSDFRKLVDYSHAFNKLVLADIATQEDAIFAIENGADLLATTLVGYTEETRNHKTPDFNLLNTLVKESSIPIFLEGGVTDPNHVEKALNIGAHGVIVGKAITMPQVITRRFVEKTRILEGNE